MNVQGWTGPKPKSLGDTNEAFKGLMVVIFWNLSKEERGPISRALYDLSDQKTRMTLSLMLMKEFVNFFLYNRKLPTVIVKKKGTH